MRIAFYAPLKPPDHPVASGDRAVARSLVAALRLAGHDVEVASDFRSFDTGDTARQERLKDLGQRLADRLLRRYERVPSPSWGRDRGGVSPPHQALFQPNLWFTYHLYHKAPDWLGPRVAGALGIPYVAAEASFAPKQASGKWALGHNAVADAIRQAAAIVQLNPADAECVLPLLDDPNELIRLAPFTDTTVFRSPDREASRTHFADVHNIPRDEPWLLTVAMMRSDQKLLSYRTLADALRSLTDLPWRLIIAGAGPAEADVRAAFAPLADRITWLGILPPDHLRRLYRAADLYVWPAIKEAFGMTLVEAQAAGLPVVAGRSGGVASIVTDNETGLLTPEGDATAFASAVRALLTDPTRRRAMGECRLPESQRAITTSPAHRSSSIASSAHSLRLAPRDRASRHPPCRDRLERGRPHPGPRRSPAQRRRPRLAFYGASCHRTGGQRPASQAPSSAPWRPRACSALPPSLITASSKWTGANGRAAPSPSFATSTAPAMIENEARGLDFRPPGGESPRDVQARLRPFLESLRDPTIAVTHKGVLRALYALATGWTMERKAPRQAARRPRAPLRSRQQRHAVGRPPQHPA